MSRALAQFKNPAQIVAYAQAIQSRWQNRVPLSGEDADIVRALFEARCRSEDKKSGLEISHFEIRTYKQQTRAFFAVFKDGSEIDFSFHKAARVVFQLA